MKKILTTVLVTIVLLVSAVPVCAEEASYDRIYQSIPESIDSSTDIKERSYWFSERLLNRAEEDVVWCVASMNGQTQAISYLFENVYSYKPLNELMAIDSVDFVLVGGFIPYEYAAKAELEFENPTQAAINYLIPLTEMNEGYEDTINGKAICWDIYQSGDPEYCCLEIAIGAYQVQTGDTLTEIAKRYESSVEQILEDNPKIENPNLIYPNDILTIK